MGIDVKLRDGSGQGNVAKVSKEGQLNVVQHPHPPAGDTSRMIPVREFFRNSAGSNDMKVDGSTTPVQFEILADPERDVYVGTISFVIADASATLNKFGNLTELSVGCKLEWVTKDEGTVLIGGGLTTNFEFIRLCNGEPSFGDGAGAFRASNISSTSEGYLPVLDIEDVFGIRFGFRLRAGTTDKLVFTIQDDVTGVDQFDAIAYGFKLRPE